MRIRPTNRRALLFAAALLATLAATWWASSLEDDPAVVAGIRRVPPIEMKRPVSAPPDGGLAVRREPWPKEAARLMQPPAPSAATVTPLQLPPAHEIPPLPFRFIGALREDNQRSVILLEGNEVLIVHAGTRIDDRYHVERITPMQVEFIYLPTRQHQTLDMIPPQY